jgi:hypothetical protein
MTVEIVVIINDVTQGIDHQAHLSTATRSNSPRSPLENLFEKSILRGLVPERAALSVPKSSRSLLPVALP